mgnify:CR=1 FL=1
MMYRRSILAAAASAMIACSLLFSGCGTKKEDTPSAPAVHYGVADLETLVKAHPKYSEYFKLETEYNHMLEQYQTERNKLIEASFKQQKIAAALADTTRRMAAENEWKAKVKEKEDTLDEGLQTLYGDIEKKHTSSAGNMTLETLSPEERAEMANLQMKLTVLGVSGEEKEQVKEKLRALMALRASREQTDMSGWTADEVKQMKEAKEKAQSELDSFSNAAAEEIRSRIETEGTADISQAEESFQEDHKEWDADWQARIDNKQKQMAELKKEIMADIEQEAARVASEKNLDMIFSKYKANINADDVTGDLVNRIVNIQK